MRKGRKKNVVLYLDPEVVREAKELGLNISKVCENALKEAVRRLKGEDCEVVRPPGFEPGFCGVEGRHPTRLDYGRYNNLSKKSRP
jgi:hypothetical protein